MKWESEQTCPECGAGLLVELSDLKRCCGSDQRDGSLWDYAYYECPICKRGVSDENLMRSVPVHLRNSIPSR